MKTLIILKNLHVENANAIAGQTWGFPGVTNFLGFVHGLSRKLEKRKGVTLKGCGIVCHEHQVLAYQPKSYSDFQFGLTRNPLTKEGKTAPFNEEGKMHFRASLVIEGDFYIDEIDFGTGDGAEDEREFKRLLTNLVLTQKLAGGLITEIGEVVLQSISEDPTVAARDMKKRLLSLLPGHVLVDRSDLLNDPDILTCPETGKKDLLKAWVSLNAIRHRAIPRNEAGSEGSIQDDSLELATGSDCLSDAEANEDTPCDWVWQQKPATGWLVPIQTGFKGISTLYDPGVVSHTRDVETPFRFVEATYGLGEWISPHRLNTIEETIWHYRHEDDWYLCEQAQ